MPRFPRRLAPGRAYRMGWSGLAWVWKGPRISGRTSSRRSLAEARWARESSASGKRVCSPGKLSYTSSGALWARGRDKLWRDSVMERLECLINRLYDPVALAWCAGFWLQRSGAATRAGQAFLRRTGRPSTVRWLACSVSAHTATSARIGAGPATEHRRSWRARGRWSGRRRASVAVSAGADSFSLQRNRSAKDAVSVSVSGNDVETGGEGSGTVAASMRKPPARVFPVQSEQDPDCTLRGEREQASRVRRGNIWAESTVVRRRATR